MWKELFAAFLFVFVVFNVLYLAKYEPLYSFANATIIPTVKGITAQIQTFLATPLIGPITPLSIIITAGPTIFFWILKLRADQKALQAKQQAEQQAVTNLNEKIELLTKLKASDVEKSDLQKQLENLTLQADSIASLKTRVSELQEANKKLAWERDLLNTKLGKVTTREELQKLIQEMMKVP